MASEDSKAQDIIRCVMCDSAANYHCTLCLAILCNECIPKHLKNRGTNHEIGLFPSKQKCLIVGSECFKHSKDICNMYCKDCQIQICPKCVTGDHRKHNFAMIEEVLEEKRAEIKQGIKKVETTILYNIQEQKKCVNEHEYGSTFAAIFAQEDLICEAVREVGSELRKQVVKHREENQMRTIQNTAKEKRVLDVIAATESLLTSNNSEKIIGFTGLKSELMNIGSPHYVRATPTLLAESVMKEDIIAIFGSLEFPDIQMFRGENIKDQLWFHGFISEKETKRLLKKNGEFLVREEKINETEERFIISTYWNGLKDFPIETEYFLEKVGGTGTVVGLVENLQTSKEALSSSNPSILQTPVDRYNFQIDYDDLKIEEEIEENMSSGEGLFRGAFGDKVVLIIANEEEDNELSKNAHFQRFFNHPNIVRLEGYSALQKPVLLAMENMSEGRLLKYLRLYGQLMSKQTKIKMCLDVARGLEHIHENNCVHGDVAARSCFVHSDYTVKIFEFRVTEIVGYKVVPDKLIPIKWTAPEICQSGKLTFMGDIWSFGVLMWEIFSSGQMPYAGKKNVTVVEMITDGYRLKSPDDTPKECYDLMLECWQHEPEDRCRLSEILDKLQTLLHT